MLHRSLCLSVGLLSLSLSLSTVSLFLSLSSLYPPAKMEGGVPSSHSVATSVYRSRVAQTKAPPTNINWHDYQPSSTLSMNALNKGRIHVTGMLAP